MKQSIISLSIFAAVGVLLLATLALPLIASAAEDANTKTLKNSGDVSFSEIDLSVETVEITANSTGFLINGVQYTNTENATKYIYSEEFKASGGANVSLMNASLFTSGVLGSYITKITITGGIATFTYSESSNLTGTVTCNCTWLFVSDDNGEWVYSEDGAYIGEGEYYTTYPIAHTSAVNVEFIAIVDSGAVQSVNGATYSGAVITDVSENVTASISNDNHYATAKATYNDTDYALGWLVPKSVNVTEDTAEGALLELIPLLLAVALVLGIIGYAISARLS